MGFEPLAKSAGTPRRFLLGSLLVVALIAAAAVATVLLEVGHVKSYFPKATLPATAIKEITPVDPGAPQTILIIGSDKRALSGNAADRSLAPRSDTMLLIRMDPGRNQTSVLSIPRDLQTQIVTDAGAATTQKINAAYTLGGSALVARTIKTTLPGLRINHIIDINFAGFRKVIDAIGCVYVFVDQRYLHRNDGTLTGNYASIDLQPGYQRLCDQSALDYARYRHTDSDFVRVARQQDFIRQAKQQIGVGSLLAKQDPLLQALQGAVHTDIHGTAVERLVKLALFSLGRPLRQVPFVSTPGPSFVTATPEQIATTVNDFLYNDPAVHVRSGHRAPGRTAAVGAGPSPGPGLIPTPADDVGLETSASIGLRFALYAPRLRVATARSTDLVRAYTLRDEQNAAHHAYAISIARGLVGEYYGIEGTDWMHPPILAGVHQTRVVGRRSFDLYADGGHIRLVAWHTPTAVYWLNNTLRDSLTNQQMLAIAKSTRPA